jgi:transposase
MMLVEGSASTASGAAEAGPRRRRWTKRQKRQLVAETLAPGASVSLIARRHDVNANLLFNWRRQARRGLLGDLPAIAAGDESLPLIPITVTADDAPGAPALDSRTGMIEIVLPSGERLRVDAGVDEPALRRVLTAIRSLS